MVKVHKIAPGADTVITLRYLPDPPPSGEESDGQKSAHSENSHDEASPGESVDVDDWPLEEDPTEEPDPNEELPAEDSNYEEIQYHVSSSHLKLSSHHFERMLSGVMWKEGIPNENDGRYHVTVEDQDEEALLILLNVLHLRNRQVPRVLSLDLLGEIARLVEYYDCAEAVELLTDMWVKDIRKSTPIPSMPCRDLVLWMYIAGVLKLPEEFTKTTAVAINLCKREELSNWDWEFPIAGFIGRSAS
jgi:hypothetical protein